MNESSNEQSSQSEKPANPPRPRRRPRTAAQVAASRANGRKSRGPVSVSGKKNSSMNALTHGLFSKRVSPACVGSGLHAEFTELHAALVRQYRPQTAVERHWVEVIAVDLVNAGACAVFRTLLMAGPQPTTAMASVPMTFAPSPGPAGDLEVLALDAIAQGLARGQQIELNETEFAAAQQILSDAMAKMYDRYAGAGNHGPDTHERRIWHLAARWMLHTKVCSRPKFEALLANPGRLEFRQREAWLQLVNHVLDHCRTAQGIRSNTTPAKIAETLPSLLTLQLYDERLERGINRKIETLEAIINRRKAAGEDCPESVEALPKFVDPVAPAKPPDPFALSPADIAELNGQPRPPAPRVAGSDAKSE